MKLDRTAGQPFMETQESRKLAVTLQHLAAQGADSAQITDAIISTWVVVEAALSPVIGKKGIAALYTRSLYLIRARYPWLSAIFGSDASMDLPRLRAALAQQESSKAASAGGAHLQTLYELLDSLIGPSLTGQLLGSAWDNSFVGFAGKDISQ